LILVNVHSLDTRQTVQIPRVASIGNEISARNR
jgi:hypothetical protein